MNFITINGKGDPNTSNEGDYLNQYIGVANTKPVPERWEKLPVEASTWTVFTVIGEFPKILQDTWARVSSEWFPTFGYE